MVLKDQTHLILGEFSRCLRVSLADGDVVRVNFGVECHRGIICLLSAWKITELRSDFALLAGSMTYLPPRRALMLAAGHGSRHGVKM